MLVLHCFEGFSLVAASGVYSVVVMYGLFISVASLVAKQELWGVQGSIVAAPGL